MEGRLIDPKHGYRFGYKAVRNHLREHHPRCPPAARKKIADRVVMHAWGTERIGRAVGVCIEIYVRHEMTDYDRRLKAGEDREAARKAIRAEANAITAEWRKP